MRRGMQSLLGQVESALGERDAAAWKAALETARRGLETLLQAADSPAAAAEAAGR
jgi:hypothetical protein